MQLVEIYQCLCDATRIRIIRLLAQKALCVCHIQEVLEEPQVKISKRLAYLKKRGVVEVRREANWRIYYLCPSPSSVLQVNLRCLEECADSDPVLSKDASRLRRLQDRFDENGPVCLPNPKRSSPKTK